MTQRRRYSQEFKHEAVELTRTPGASIGQIARDLGINANLLARWRRKASGLRPVPVRNHLERDFSAAEPNIRWATDITYIRTAEAWLYLCVVIDLYSKAVVGWSMSRRQDRQLVLSAVLMALWQRQSAEEPVYCTQTAERNSPAASTRRSWPITTLCAA